MPSISAKIKRLIVDAYKSGESGSQAQTAKIFGVSPSAVARALRRERETGSVEHKPRGGNNPRKVDPEWLEKNARQFPDHTLDQRIKALIESGGPRVSSGTMSRAMKAIGWTFKKNSWSPRETPS